MKTLSFSMVLMLFICASSTDTQVTAVPDTPLRFKTYVSVTCDNEQIKSSIESHIKRELRSLHDVDVVPLQTINPSEYSYCRVI